MLVSCVMPTTKHRRQWIPRAVRCFLDQTYADRELIVLADAAGEVEDLLPADPRIHFYHRPFTTLGAKRNIVNGIAHGDAIAHWDDDDWSAPHRLTAQVERLHEADVCGLRTLHWTRLEPDGSRKWWVYSWPASVPGVLGNTMMYRKDFWAAGGFPEIQIASDTRWMRDRKPPPTFVACADELIVIGEVHDNNVSPKRTRPPVYRPVDPPAVELT